MVLWIVFCTVWFNFVLGALIPITPKLNENLAGVAFSSFVFMKILVFVPAGLLSDRIGHFTGFFISLAAQVMTLGLIIFRPDLVWVSRSAEGITLAFGTVAALSLFRLYAKSTQEFGRSISMLMGIGSAGFLLGPFFGYLVPPDKALWGLLAGSSCFCVIHLALYRKHRSSINDVLSDSSSSGKGLPWIILICFALVKGLGVGTQPLVGWWATHSIGLTPTVAGFSFVAASVGFMLANWKPRLNLAFAGIAGIALVELSLSGSKLLWWPGLLCLGLFSGTIINLCLTRLGWNNPENLGLKNSKFLALSDIPMMLTPAALWNLREPADWGYRLPLLMVVTLTVLILMKRRT